MLSTRVLDSSSGYSTPYEQKYHTGNPSRKVWVSRVECADCMIIVLGGLRIALHTSYRSNMHLRRIQEWAERDCTVVLATVHSWTTGAIVHTSVCPSDLSNVELWNSRVYNTLLESWIVDLARDGPEAVKAGLTVRS